MTPRSLLCAILVPEWSADRIFLSAFTRSMASYQEPSGPLYIAAALLEAGHQVLFMDGALHGNDAMVQRLGPQAPDFVGVYACAPLWPSARQLLSAVKHRIPAAVTAVGGPYAMALGTACLAECPALDLAFTSEAEASVVEVLSVLEDRGAWATLPGLVFRNENGSLCDTGYREPVADLDRLPFPARHLLGPDLQRCSLPPGGYRARPVAHLIGSRGCTNRCLYCFHAEREARIRFRSPDSLVAEALECVHRYGFREIRFLDDNFTGDRERVLRICELFARHLPGVPWYVSSRVDTVDPELLRIMRRSGCWAILYGVETGTERGLLAIRKGVTLAQVRATVAATHAAGIKMFLPFMFGLPGETFEDGLRTIEFALELDPHYANFNTLTPFPGTPLWDQGDALGTLCRDPERLTFQGGAFVPKTMTRDELETLRKLAFRRFYSRPSFILRWLLSLRNRHDLQAMARGALSLATLWLRPRAFRRREPGA